jgi:hypothetical protein
MHAFDMRSRTGLASLRRGVTVLLCIAMLLMDANAACSAISTTGDVSPDPNTTTSSQTLYIGGTADGTI